MTEEGDRHRACPDLETWSAYVDRSGAETDRKRLRAHLRSCDRCFGTVSSLLISLGRGEAADGWLEESDDIGGRPAIGAEDPAAVPAGPGAPTGAPAEPTPPDLLAKARELVPQREARPRRWTLHGAAAGVLLAVVSSLYVGQQYLGEPRSSTALFLGDSGELLEEESLEYAPEARISAAAGPRRTEQAARGGGPRAMEAASHRETPVALESPSAAEPAAGAPAEPEGESSDLIVADAVDGAGAGAAQPAEALAVGALGMAGPREVPPEPGPPAAAEPTAAGSPAPLAEEALDGRPPTAPRAGPAEPVEQRDARTLVIAGPQVAPVQPAPEPLGRARSGAGPAARSEQPDVWELAAGDSRPALSRPEPAATARGDSDESPVYGALAGAGRAAAELAEDAAGQPSPVAAAVPHAGLLTGGASLKSAAPAGKGLVGRGGRSVGESGGAGGPGVKPEAEPPVPVETALEAGREAAHLQLVVAQEGDGEAILARIESLREKLAQLGPAPRTTAALRAMTHGLLTSDRAGERATGEPMAMERRLDARTPQAGDRDRLLLLGQRLDHTMSADFPGTVSAYLACGAWVMRVELAAAPGRGGFEGTDLEELAALGAEVLVRLRQAGADPQVTRTVADLVARLEDRTVPPDSGAILETLKALRIELLPSP